MPKMAPGELSEHAIKGFRLSCGWYMKDGKKTPKVFWLGKDKNRAILEAQKIRWAAPVAAAMGGWTKEYEKQVRGIDTLELVQRRFQEAERVRVELAPHLAPQVVVAMPNKAPGETDPTSSSTPTGAPMLHAALDAYVEAAGQRPGSRAYKNGIHDSIEAVKHYRGDCTLSHIDYAWLEDFTAYLKGRPLSRKKSKTSGKREPIKPYTVKRLLQHTRQGVQWIHRQRESKRFGGWRAPAEWDQLFSVELTQIMSKAERDKAADGPEQLTIDEIRRLYKAACDGVTKLHSILLLMGLFAAQGQTELSTVRRDELDLENETFTHRRNKTGQKGIYWLPPELVTRLDAYFCKNPRRPEELAFLTREGEPLVTAKSDAVRQAWDDWRSRAKVDRPGIGFYGLRRFFGDFATRHGGDAAGDVALAHTAKSVRGKHYSNYRNFESIQQIGRKLYHELTTAGMFASSADAASPDISSDS